MIIKIDDTDIEFNDDKICELSLVIDSKFHNKRYNNHHIFVINSKDHNVTKQNIIKSLELLKQKTELNLEEIIDAYIIYDYLDIHKFKLYKKFKKIINSDVVYFGKHDIKIIIQELLKLNIYTSKDKNLIEIIVNCFTFYHSRYCDKIYNKKNYIEYIELAKQFDIFSYIPSLLGDISYNLSVMFKDDDIESFLEKHNLPSMKNIHFLYSNRKIIFVPQNIENIDKVIIKKFLSCLLIDFKVNIKPTIPNEYL